MAQKENDLRRVRSILAFQFDPHGALLPARQHGHHSPTRNSANSFHFWNDGEGKSRNEEKSLTRLDGVVSAFIQWVDR